MPGKIALINYTGCHPERCDSGVCRAVLACPRKLLMQETPYEAPMPNPSLCQGRQMRGCLSAKSSSIELILNRTTDVNGI